LPLLKKKTYPEREEEEEGRKAEEEEEEEEEVANDVSAPKAGGISILMNFVGRSCEGSLYPRSLLAR
jgi:hypothetical protein